MAKRKMEFSIVALFDGTALSRGLKAAERTVVTTLRGMTRKAGLGAGFAGIGGGTGLSKLFGARPGGVGGIFSGITQGAASLALAPARILGGFLGLIPGIGGILTGIVGTAANILQGLVGIAANVVGAIVNVFAGLVKAVVSLFGKILSAGFSILGKIPKMLLLAGGAAVGASAGFFALVNGVAKAGEEIAKLSVQTGLSVKFLSEMQHVLALTDVGMESLKVGVRGVALAVTGAAQGQKEYLELFKRLGVNFRDTNGRIKSSEELFVELSDAIRRIPNDMQRLAMAQKVFGRGAQELMPLIMAPKGGIAAGRERARQQGTVWTEAEIRAAEDYRAALAGVTGALRGLKQQFLIPFMEPFAGMMERFSAWLRSHKDQVREWGEKAAAAFEDWSARAIKAVTAAYVWVSTRDWAAAWEGIKALPKKLWEDLIPDIGALFLKKTEKGLEMGPLTETIVDGFKVVIAFLRTLWEEFWNDWAKGARLAVANVISGIAQDIGLAATKKFQETAEVAGKVAYEATPIPAGIGLSLSKIGIKRVTPTPWEQVSPEEKARWAEKGKIPIGTTVEYKAMQGASNALLDVGLALIRGMPTTEEHERTMTELHTKEAQALTEVAVAAQALTAAAGRIGGEVGAIVTGALPAKAPEVIAAQEQAAKRAPAEALARETPIFQSTQARAESLRGTSRLLQKAGKTEAAAEYAGRASNVDLQVENLLDRAVSLLEDLSQRDQTREAQIANLDRRLSRLGTARR